MASNKIKPDTTSTPTKAPSTSKHGSKTAFVLSQPVDVPAAQVVAKAAALGLKIREKYVYNIRATARQKSGQPHVRQKPGPKPGNKRSAALAGSGTTAAPAQLGPAPGQAPRQATRAESQSSVEARFVEIALDVGLARATDLLERLRTRVKAIVL